MSLCTSGSGMPRLLVLGPCTSDSGMSLLPALDSGMPALPALQVGIAVAAAMGGIA